MRQFPFKVVEPEIQVLEAWPFEDDFWEGANEAIVAYVKLVH